MPKQIDLNPIVTKLKSFYEQRRRLPSFSELGDLAGYKSKGGAQRLVCHLVERGHCD